MLYINSYMRLLTAAWHLYCCDERVTRWRNQWRTAVVITRGTGPTARRTSAKSSTPTKTTHDSLVVYAYVFPTRIRTIRAMTSALR